MTKPRPQLPLILQASQEGQTTDCAAVGSSDVVDPAEVDEDLVRDVTEILTGLCVRLYGRGAAASRARRSATMAR